MGVILNIKVEAHSEAKRPINRVSEREGGIEAFLWGMNLQ